MTYAFEYFQVETRVPLERMSRVYHKGRASPKKNVCYACFKLNLNNIHRREITGRCKFERHRGVDITDMVGIFMFRMFNQSWRHKRYIEFMWLQNHTFDAFMDYLCVRDALCGTVMNDDEVEYYYEDMVRSHFDAPAHFDATWDDDYNIINFHLNGTGTIVVNAHPSVQ